MCGFVGIALSRASRREVDRGRLVRARDTLLHRGPDDAGLYVGPRVGLGHRRLSIVDVKGGHQPFASDDGVLRLVYNGEVYNHLDVRRDLEARGHRYRTRCDTESVLRLCQTYGANGVQRMRGMFAFALWNGQQETLLLTRDRLGIKPLYYALLDDGSIAFASEMKAILELGVLHADLNRRVLPDFLANHAPSGEETLFRGIRRLPPGHTLRWQDGMTHLDRYWEARFEPSSASALDDDPVGTFRELLKESVRLRLMADVPLGVFLSGGIDSAAITGLMASLVDQPIKTFSVAFDEREANELSFARHAAAAFRTDHHEVVIGPTEFFDALSRLIWHEDEPIAHPSSVPLCFVAALAREHVKVVLTGEGSDELLGGYGRYWRSLLNLRLGGWLEHYAPEFGRRALRAAVGLVPERTWFRQRAERSFLCLPADVPGLYLDSFAVFSRARQKQLLRPEILEDADVEGPYDCYERLLERSTGWPPLEQLLHLDVNTYLHELLMKQDQMSMAASVESRVPFLDHHLVEFAAQLPREWKLRGRRGKWILREAMRGVLPHGILTRSKMGFPVPFGAWARGRYHAFVEDTVLSSRAEARNLFNRAYVRRLLGEHRSGHVDHSERLWSLLNLELWLRRFVDGEDLGLPAAQSVAAVGMG